MHNIRQPNPKTNVVNIKTSQQCFDEIFGFVMVLTLVCYDLAKVI
jgi:hypothetical protein